MRPTADIGTAEITRTVVRSSIVESTLPECVRGRVNVPTTRSMSIHPLPVPGVAVSLPVVKTGVVSPTVGVVESV